MRCNVYVISYEIDTGYGKPTVETRLFSNRQQADFYFGAKLATLKKRYAFAVENAETPNGSWSILDSAEEKYWSLSNRHAKISYTLQLVEQDFELEGPRYSRLEELLCNLVDHIYSVYDYKDATEILTQDIGLDPFEMQLYGLSEQELEGSDEGDEPLKTPVSTEETAAPQPAGQTV